MRHRSTGDHVAFDCVQAMKWVTPAVSGVLGADAGVTPAFSGVWRTGGRCDVIVSLARVPHAQQYASVDVRRRIPLIQPITIQHLAIDNNSAI